MHQAPEDSERSPVVIALADRHGFGEFFSRPTKRAYASDAALDFSEEGQVHTHPEVTLNAFAVESDGALARRDSGRVELQHLNRATRLPDPKRKTLAPIAIATRSDRWRRGLRTTPSPTLLPCPAVRGDHKARQLGRQL